MGGSSLCRHAGLHDLSGVKYSSGRYAHARTQEAGLAVLAHDASTGRHVSAGLVLDAGVAGLCACGRDLRIYDVHPGNSRGRSQFEVHRTGLGSLDAARFHSRHEKAIRRVRIVIRGGVGGESAGRTCADNVLRHIHRWYLVAG